MQILIMKIRTYLLSFFALVASKAYSQVQVGEMMIADTVIMSDGIKIMEGNKRLIEIDTIDIIRDSGSAFEIKYKGATPLLYYDKHNEHAVWVKNGIWKTYDSIGTQIKADYWQNGINLWSKEFDKDGELKKHYYQDLVNDSTFYDYYIGKRLFKRKCYTPHNKNKSFLIYYPNSVVRLSNGELDFSVNFLYKPTDTKTLNIYSKNNEVVQINKFECSSDNFRIVDVNGREIKNKLLIKPSDTTTIKIVYKPKPARIFTEDTLIIRTEKENYEVFLNANANHIEYKNVEKIEIIELSKSKDKFLNLASLGTITTLRINKAEQENNSEKFAKSIRCSENYIQVDLAKLNIGEYYLYITSCHTGNTIKLKLIE